MGSVFIVWRQIPWWQLFLLCWSGFWACFIPAAWRENGRDEIGLFCLMRCFRVSQITPNCAELLGKCAANKSIHVWLRLLNLEYSKQSLLNRKIWAKQTSPNYTDNLSCIWFYPHVCMCVAWISSVYTSIQTGKGRNNRNSVESPFYMC